MSLDLSICILTYNTRDLLSRCLDNLLAIGPEIKFEIILIDNGSTDGSATFVREKYPQVTLIELPTNRFFPAMNIGFQRSKGEFFLILNSDVEVPVKTLPALVEHLRKNPKTGAVGPAMYYASGKIHRICSSDYPPELAFYNFTFLGKLFPERSRRLNEQIFFADWDRLSSKTVDIYPDSCLMVRRSALVNPTLYDEGYKLYFTENDLCLQLRKEGWTIDYLSTVKVFHQEMQTVRRVSPKIISQIYRDDIFHYFHRHHGLWTAWGLAAMIQVTRGFIFLFKFLRLKKFKPNLVWGI